MEQQRLRAIFYDPDAAGHAASALRDQGVGEVDLQHDQPATARRQSAARDSRFPILALGVVVGGGIGLTLGFFLGLPSLALPSVREDTSRIAVVFLVWFLGPAVLGALVGGMLAAVASAGSRGSPGGAMAAPAAAKPATRIVVSVPVADAATADELRRRLFELKATAVEPSGGRPPPPA